MLSLIFEKMLLMQETKGHFFCCGVVPPFLEKPELKKKSNIHSIKEESNDALTVRLMNKLPFTTCCESAPFAPDLNSMVSSL